MQNFVPLLCITALMDGRFNCSAYVIIEYSLLVSFS